MSDVVIIIIVMVAVMVAVVIAVVIAVVVVVVVVFSIDTTLLHPALLGSLFGISLFYDIAL